MSISKANKLMLQGKYSEAEALYRKLYQETGLNIYKFGLEYVIKKRSNDFSDIKVISQNQLETPVFADVRSNKKILFVTAGLKGPTPGGGIATCFHSMIKTIGTLSDVEVDVIYIAHPYYSRGNYDTWKEVYKKECNANLLSVVVNEKNYGTKEMKRSCAILEFLLKNDGLYDSVVFHDFMGLAYYPLLAKRMGLGLASTKIVISAHGNHTLSNFFGKKKIDSWNTKAIIFMERMSLKYADEITSPSHFYKEWLSENLEADTNKIEVLPNIIYKDDNKDSIDVKFNDNSKKLVAYYGRIERLKGVDILIEAIKKFNQQTVSQNVLIAGVSTKIDGIDAKDYILKKLSDVNCEVQFKFNCQPAEVFNYINKHQGVCVLPTLGENAPCVVVECILHGVRFLASDIPGIKEMVNQKYHHLYLFKTGSVKELVEKFAQEIDPPTKEALSYDMQQNEKNWVDFLSQKENKLLKKPFVVKEINQELVSVIIPTSDRPKLLEESVKSMREQTYKNIEIIIVDDCSTEYRKNQEIANKYHCGYIYLSEKSYKGKACNIGVSYSNGDFICFFDDDDIADESMIARYMRAYSLMDVDILSGFCAVFEHEKREDFHNFEYKSLALGGGLEVNLSTNMFGKGSFMVKRSIFDKVGGYEVDGSTVPMVDYRFYIKSALENAKISIVPYVQYYYRKNSPNSLFYQTGDDRTKKFLAKTSIQNILQRKLGRDIALAVAPMIWDISLPVFE